MAAVCLVLASVAKGGVVDFRLVALPAPSGSDTAATVPTSQASFALGSSIYLEVWVQTTNTNGLSSASLDLQFDSSLATAVSITRSSVFSTLTHASINNPSGVVDDLSGSHLGPCTDAIAVAPNWDRVAVVEFEVNAEGVLLIQGSATGSKVYGTAICGAGDVDPANIIYDWVTISIGEASIPAASAWGLFVMFLCLLVAGTRTIPTRSARMTLGRLV